MRVTRKIQARGAKDKEDVQNIAWGYARGDLGELRLKQRGAEFSIMLDHNELMNSRLSGSEEALATLACARSVVCRLNFIRNRPTTTTATYTEPD